MRLALITVLAVSTLVSAQTHTTVRHHHEQVTDESTADLSRAQDAIGRRDFETARKIMQQFTAKNPDDYRGWYTLGYAESSAGDKTTAIADYKKTLELKSDFFEANLNLGLLLAQAGDKTAAVTYIRKATTETPSGAGSAQRNKALASAWDALGSLSSGAEAAKAFQTAISLDPEDVSAKQSLANASVCPAGQIQSQGACVAPSTTDLEKTVANAPNDAVAASLLAHKYIESKEYVKAEPLLKQIVANKPGDADSNYNYGFVLMHLQRMHEAQNYLLKALQLNPRLTEAYGDLAIAAAANKEYVLSMRVLDARAKLLPENSGTYYLRATNLDHLQLVKPASIMYRKYLAAAHGESPDDEWRAKHRLIALDPNNETKGKEK